MLDLKQARVWLNLFRTCYTVRMNEVGAWFERTALPVTGGAAEQPAKDMQALELIEAVANQVLREEVREARERNKQKRDG